MAKISLQNKILLPALQKWIKISLMETIVMKFGGAALATAEHFARIAEIILIRAKQVRVVVVVSAMENTTDQLLALAKQVHPTPPLREQDMLVSVGERISMALLAMALQFRNRDAISFTGSQSGIITSLDHSEARIVDVRPRRIQTHLDRGAVVIVAGFQGVSLEGGEITTLGRGGSDTTAVALAIALRGQVEFYKNVLGIYKEDPKQSPEAVPIPHLSYSQALEIMRKGAKVLHPRAIELAERNRLRLHVRSFLDPELHNGAGTIVGDLSSTLVEKPIFECS